MFDFCGKDRKKINCFHKKTSGCLFLYFLFEQ